MSDGAVNRKRLSSVYGWLAKIIDRTLPAACRLCGTFAADGRELCAPCSRDLPWLDTTCRRCAMPLPAAGVCAACLRRPPHMEATIAALHYREPVDGLVKQFKFGRQLSAGRLLAQLLLERLRNERDGPPPDCLLPMPLHARRLRVRGFNQATEIARHLSRWTGVPVDTRLLRRSKSTATQSELPARQRRANVRGAFAVTERPDYRRVALIDDVMTTGHTVNEAARCLRRAGMKEVEAWIVARVPHKL